MTKNRRLHLRMSEADVQTHRHSVNPFTVDWQPPKKTRYKKLDLGTNKRLFDEAGNEAKGKMLIAYERDPTRFVKLIHECLPDLGLLSNTARKVLDFAMFQALPDNNVVWMPLAEAMHFCRFTQHKSFYDGLNELIVYEYIARSEKVGFHFLNPRKFFTGNRPTLPFKYVGPKFTFTHPQPEE